MKYRREIDGLRALAVIPVILFHAGSNLLTGGYLGVDIFFVISGYLIGSIILQDLAKGVFSFKKFYERRARRILPALSLVMVSCLPFAWMWMTPIQFEEFSHSLVATSMFISNILFWKESGYFDDPTEIKPLIHTWSLSIEEQFYIFFPIALIFLWKLSKNRLILIFGAVALLSVIGAEIASEDFVEFNFYLLPSRIWELLVGVILALLQQKYSRPINFKFSKLLPLIGLGMIIIPMIVFHKHTDHPGLLTLIPVIGTALIIFFAGNNDIVTKLLSTKLFVGIGLISYSLYLWHQPLFAFARIFSINKLSTTTYVILVALTFILAYLSWRFIEQPFRNKEVIVSKQAWQFTTVTLIFFISFGTLGSWLKGIPTRFNKELLAIANYKDSNPNRLFKQDDKKCLGREISEACTLGLANTKPSYALIGDSHAGSLALHIDKFLKNNEVAGIDLVNPGCPYVPGFRNKDSDKCNKVNTPIKERILKDDISTVIIAGRYVYQMEKENFDNGEGGKEKVAKSFFIPVDSKKLNEVERQKLVAEGYRKTVQELLDFGKKVILVYPIPEVGWHVPRTLFKVKVTNKDIETISTSYDLYLKRSKKVIDAFNGVKNHPNLVRVYPSNIFCNSFIKGRCVANYEDKIFYSDDDHLNIEGSKLLVQEMFKIVKEKWKGI